MNNIDEMYWKLINRALIEWNDWLLYALNEHLSTPRQFNILMECLHLYEIVFLIQLQFFLFLAQCSSSRIIYVPWMKINYFFIEYVLKGAQIRKFVYLETRQNFNISSNIDASF
jgi:hypothetical protein